MAGCFEKRTIFPASVGDLAARLVAEAHVPVRRVDASSISKRVGRPVIAYEFEARGAKSFVMTIDSAARFYSIQYNAVPGEWEAGAAERDRVLASFRITDRTADKGPTRWKHAAITADKRTLSEARKSFHTKVHPGRPDKPKVFDGKPAEEPPAGVFVRTNIHGSQGRLAAYITPDPKDGKKHPVVVWAHGGFGGIDHDFWEPAPRSNDQSARAFRDAGIVLAVGSWRAENDNPGDYELYYGEVDDFLALRDHVRTLPYVDPDRIYLAGHSSGGTLALLAAEKSDGFRAAFTIGASPVMSYLDTYDRYGGIPFDRNDHNELLLRSAAPFFASIRKPTFFFEGAGTESVGDAQWMEDEAAKVHVPFKAFVALQADHFTILAPLTELIAKKILADTGPTSNIAFTASEIDGLQVTKPNPRPQRKLFVHRRRHCRPVKVCGAG